MHCTTKSPHGGDLRRRSPGRASPFLSQNCGVRKFAMRQLFEKKIRYSPFLFFMRWALSYFLFGSTRTGVRGGCCLSPVGRAERSFAFRLCPSPPVRQSSTLPLLHARVFLLLDDVFVSCRTPSNSPLNALLIPLMNKLCCPSNSAYVGFNPLYCGMSLKPYFDRRAFST